MAQKGLYTNGGDVDSELLILSLHTLQINMDFSLPHHKQLVSETHPASHSTDTKRNFS
jgi:hypothetical protein